MWDAKMDAAESFMPNFNWWKFAHYVTDYGKISLWGVAAIFQLLSDFGVMSDINIMVWVYGLAYGGSVVSVVAWIAYYVAYDTSYSVSMDQADAN